ncbi:hypothetical protein ATCC90586_004058 [Pythium insidiosum]|nr:hypothetical protein ATCC90586_004058 [Pythium insidiosum]
MAPTVVPCGSYDIVLGSTLLSSAFVAQDILRQVPSASTFLILTDANVYPLYAMPLYQQLRSLLVATPKRVLVHAIPAGEASKSRAMKARIEDEVLFQQRCHRDTCVIAVGGGVVGDLSGYVAATYMRGVPFIQVPTSLLACVDSSIGGKTGIDVDDYGKNLLGAFHMPQRVYIDLSVLKTLPQRELVNGMAEVIKAGAIYDAALFELLEASSESVLALSDMELVQRIVAMAVQVKAHVVTQDTKEQGLRAILNFGHSIGHGIEALVQPELLHGECVSIGMIKEAEIARGMGVFALAAVANGTTKITGIANQRVKECNRIEVMVTELRKIGVECGELPDVELRVDLLNNFNNLNHVASEVSALRAKCTLPIIFTVRSQNQGGAFPDDQEALMMQLLNLAQETGFAGGSITIPLKVDIVPHLDFVSPAVRAIGAVNTLTRLDRSGCILWKGDNTDWLGILRPIERRLKDVSVPDHPLVALIIGAGGTSMAAAYAMQQLGVHQLFVFNRTVSKAQAVASRFGATALGELTPTTLPRVDIVISTVPATANVTIPDYLLPGEHPVVVLDAAYMPPITPCLAHAHGRGAMCIQGYEMLYEQAAEQYLRWNKITQVHDVDIEVFKRACLSHIPESERLD